MRFRNDKQRKAVMAKINNWKPGISNRNFEVWTNSRRNEVMTVDKNPALGLSVSVSKISPKGRTQRTTSGRLSIKDDSGRVIRASNVRMLAKKYRMLNND